MTCIVDFLKSNLLKVEILESFWYKLEAINIEKHQSFYDRVTFVKQNDCQYGGAHQLNFFLTVSSPDSTFSLIFLYILLYTCYH